MEIKFSKTHLKTPIMFTGIIESLGTIQKISPPTGQTGFSGLKVISQPS